MTYNKFIKKLLTRSIFLSLTIYCNVNIASENDHYSKRESVLKKNSTQTLSIIDTLINEQLKKAVDEINIKNKNNSTSCQEDDILNKVNSILSGNVIEAAVSESKIQTLMKHSPLLVGLKDCTTKKESVYSSLNYQDAPILNSTPLSMGCVFHLNNHVIGDDKFGHFFTQGFSYFKRKSILNYSQEEILKWGEKTEKTYFGLGTTGIYSHADLVANYEGQKFWENLIGKDESSSSYLYCQNGVWKINQNKSFTFNDYIHEGWDEAKNPNFYSHHSTSGKKVKEKIRQLGFNIPLETDSCIKLVERYQKDATLLKSLVAPSCLVQGKNALINKKLVPQAISKIQKIKKYADSVGVYQQCSSLLSFFPDLWTELAHSTNIKNLPSKK